MGTSEQSSSRCSLAHHCPHCRGSNLILSRVWGIVRAVWNLLHRNHFPSSCCLFLLSAQDPWRFLLLWGVHCFTNLIVRLKDTSVLFKCLNFCQTGYVSIRWMYPKLSCMLPPLVCLFLTSLPVISIIHLIYFLLSYWFCLDKDGGVLLL